MYEVFYPISFIHTINNTSISLSSVFDDSEAEFNSVCLFVQWGMLERMCLFLELVRYSIFSF